MKALGLLLLRSGFSFLVAVWAAARIVSPEGGIPLLAVWLPGVQPDALSIQLLGGLGVLLAVLVLTGFFRLAAYPMLVLGLLAGLDIGMLLSVVSLSDIIDVQLA